MEHTLYSIECTLSTASVIMIGKLGTFSFPPGYYVYVGSAKKNIQKRIERHIRTENKALHWHFDYLRPYVSIIHTQTYDENIGECGLFQKLIREQNGNVLIPRFGSSDCRCPAHLFYVPKKRLSQE